MGYATSREHVRPFYLLSRRVVHKVQRSEYVTIASIMVAMTVWDFVIGVFFGIIVSCAFQAHHGYINCNLMVL
jgi:MFS superfamily sulfate permease-like transporter